MDLSYAMLEKHIADQEELPAIQMAAVLGRADGIGIIFVPSSFRMVSIHSVILRFDLNLGNPNRTEGCGRLRCHAKGADIAKRTCKAARDKSDLTVEELTNRVGITERYLYRIENEGKVPTFEVLKKIVRELAIDGNFIFYPEKSTKDSVIEDLVRMLYSCDDRSLKIIRATVKAALESQTENE